LGLAHFFWTAKIRQRLNFDKYEGAIWPLNPLITKKPQVRLTKEMAGFIQHRGRLLLTATGSFPAGQQDSGD